MDRFDAMRVFTRVVERRSFTLAAQDTGLPRSTVTDAIKQLETRLGVRLLQRTTRHVSPTLDGEAYYRRCLVLMADLEEAEAAFAGAKPKGLLHVEVQGTLARHFLLPSLPGFFEQYPDIELFMSESDRWVDVVREGVDCVVRYGQLPDSDMVARRVATLERITCAAPSYLKRFGTPTDFTKLDSHRMVGIRLSSTSALTPLQFVKDGTQHIVMLPTTMSVTGPESYLPAVRLGFGIAQLPYFHIQDDLKSGALVPLIEKYPPPTAPVSLLYPRNRQLSPRVRVFLDWAQQEFSRRADSMNRNITQL
ncbi:LysR family transcriptional regulator [Flaviflagellibacter deserti]|jgi:DNA-binding transcriptional LysR family regulator|uniref:LysR family transcriptional regulator n=1 Tax=Flaviflagellibacter deserti TaxID=2267266 RepID=A0ABV9YX74_9HYPH